MPLQISSHNEFGIVLVRMSRTLRVAIAACAVTMVMVALRGPISTPLSDLELERQLLAGSDALLERMVIPPHRPDWVLMDCSNSPTRNSAYDRVRQSLCEATGKVRATSSRF